MNFLHNHVILLGKEVLNLARHARIKKNFGVFHIHQTSGEEVALFQNDADRDYFLEILQRAQRKFAFKLYAYCVHSPHEYHLILDPNGSDLSQIMKSINIGYAMHVKSTEPLFRDRYKSELLDSPEQILQIMDILRHRPEQGNERHCYHQDIRAFELEAAAGSESALDFAAGDSCREEAAPIGCINCIETFADAQAHLKKVAGEGGSSVEELLKNKMCRNQLIKDFRRQSTLSLKELGQLFGGLSESSVCKILNQ